MFEKIKLFVQENKPMLVKVGVAVACAVAGAVVASVIQKAEETSFSHLEMENDPEFLEMTEESASDESEE